MNWLLAPFASAVGSASFLQLPDPLNDSDGAVDPADATAGVTLQSDGDIILVSIGGDSGDWIVPKSAAPGDVQVRMVTVSGTVTTGTVDTWLALTSSRTWTVTQTSPGTKTFVGTLELRHGTGATEVSVSCTLTAEVNL